MTWRLAVSLAAILGCALPGCGKKQEGAGDGVVLTVWETYNVEERAVFRELVTEFEAAHPGIAIRSTNLPFMGAEPKILTALATRTTPDIARVDGSFLPKLATRGALLPLDEYVPASFRDEIVSAALLSNLVEGRLFGLPDQVNCLCLFRNRQLLRDAGLDPDETPATWDDLIRMGKKLTSKDKGVFGFGMRNSLWWSLPFYNTYGAPLLNEEGTRCLLNEKRAVQAFQLKVDLYQKHGIEGGGWMAGGIRDDLGFQTHKYAMVFNGPWAVGTLSKGNIDFGVGLIPAGPEGTSTTVGGNDLVVFRSCKHPAEAARFLMFIASKKSQILWCNALGQVPVNRLANEELDFERHPYLEVFIEQMKTAVPRPQVAIYPEIENAVNPEMQAALDGSKSVQQAMDAAVREVDAILEREKEAM
ncbi:MAG: extracellular solute-binding protein [Candidatus Eisenbacteria sp.]|nr:extracellular solute-binding protein [Candidatus Eisenbacteria bacterium]